MTMETNWKKWFHLQRPLLYSNAALSPPAGSTPTPFPYNPLIMRFPSGTVSSASPSSGQQGAPAAVQGGRPWGEEEPKPLLMSQYETLSDSE